MTIEFGQNSRIGIELEQPRSGAELTNAYSHNPWYENWGQLTSACANASLTNHL